MSTSRASRSGLPLAAQVALRLASRLVPARLRGDWLAEWAGELVCLRRREPRADLLLLRRSLGSFPDAFWIRTHEWSPDMLLQDLRFAVRSHLRRPGFALVAIITLALGIGANTALFGVVNGLLLERLPYPDADRLVRLYGFNTERGIQFSNANPNDLLDVHAGTPGLQDLAYHTSTSRTLTGVDEPRRLTAAYVGSSYFQVLGARPALGRWFLPEEGVDGNHRVVVLSHATWQAAFGGDDAVIGTEVMLSGQPYSVVGVALPTFADPFFAYDLWHPWPHDPENRYGHFMRAVGRIAPGTSLTTVQEQIDAAYAHVAAEHEKPGRGITAVPLHESIVGPTRPMVLLLFGAVGFLLLIVCANLANLMLARAMNRQQETAVRMALGAGRARLVRQLITESLLLAVAGGLAGLAVAVVLLRAAAVTLVADLPELFVLDLHLRVVGFCFLASVATGVMFGLAPALQATGQRVTRDLRDGGRSGEASGRHGMRGALVVAEVSLSLILLVGAGLMIRSLGNLRAVDPGFDPDHLLTLRLSVPAADYPDDAESIAFYDELLLRIDALDSVDSVGAVNRLPFSGSYSCDLFVLEDWPMPERGKGKCAEERVVNGAYFETLGMTLASGRWLSPTDTADAEPVIVVSNTMASRYIADQEPLGRGFKWGLHDERPFRRVVGVAADIKHVDLTRGAMTEVYMPHDQYPSYRTMWIVARADDPAALVPEIRSILRAMDPQIPIFSVSTMSDRVEGSLADALVGARVLGAFAGLAMLLASIGLYGVLAFSVSRRTHEIGVRMALGAAGGNVVRMVLRQAMTLVAVGIVIGLLGAWALSGALGELLFEIRPDDPVTFAGVTGALLLVALAACWIPARRATRVDPVCALKGD